MTYSVNQKNNPYQQPAMGVNPQLPNGTPLPMGINGIDTSQLQNINTGAIVDKSALRGVKKEDEDAVFTKENLLLSVPVMIGMDYGMDKFNHASAGAPKKSVVGKIEAFGDKIGSKIPFVDNALNSFFNKASWLKSKIVPKSKILSAFFETPSVPEAPSARMISKGTPSELAQDALQNLKAYLDSGKSLQGGVAHDVETMLKDHKYTTPEDIQKVVDICKKQSLNLEYHPKNAIKIPLSLKLTGKQRYLSDWIPQASIINRKVIFSEYVNKINTFIAPTGKTFLGKKLPQWTIRVLEGLTNGTAGGRIAVFMGAFFIADAIGKTIKAPNENGEKRKVFAENMISNVGMYTTIPLGIGIMNAFGGFKYVGIAKDAKDTKAGVDAYRTALKAFNERAEKTAKGQFGGFTNEAEYKAAKEEVKKLLGGHTKLDFKNDGVLKTVKKALSNIIYKPMRGFSRLWLSGRERLMPYTPQSTNVFRKTLNGIKNAHYKVKGWGGYPLRMAVFMFVIAKYTNEILARGSHLLFGRPKHSILDIGKEEPEKAETPKIIYPEKLQQQQGQMQQPQQVQPQQVQHQQVMQPIQQNQQLAQNVYNPNQSNQRKMIPTENEPQKRRYIPSSDGVKVTVADPQEEKAKEAMMKSYISEKIANKYV